MCKINVDGLARSFLYTVLLWRCIICSAYLRKTFCWTCFLDHFARGLSIRSVDYIFLTNIYFSYAPISLL